jgi:hypothetical protein
MLCVGCRPSGWTFLGLQLHRMACGPTSFFIIVRWLDKNKKRRPPLLCFVHRSWRSLPFLHQNSIAATSATQTPTPLDHPCRCPCFTTHPAWQLGGPRLVLALMPGNRLFGGQLATEAVTHVLAPDDIDRRCRCKEKCRALPWSPLASRSCYGRSAPL